MFNLLNTIIHIKPVITKTFGSNIALVITDNLLFTIRNYKATNVINVLKVIK